MAGGCQCFREIPLLLRTLPVFYGALGVPAPQLCPLFWALIFQPSGSPSCSPWKIPSTFWPLGLGIAVPSAWNPLPCAHPRLVWVTRILSWVSSHRSPCQKAPDNSPNPITGPVRNTLSCSGSLGAQVSNKHPRKTSSPPSSRVVPPYPRTEELRTHSPPLPKLIAP